MELSYEALIFGMAITLSWEVLILGMTIEIVILGVSAWLSDSHTEQARVYNTANDYCNSHSRPFLLHSHIHAPIHTKQPPYSSVFLRFLPEFKHLCLLIIHIQAICLLSLRFFIDFKTNFCRNFDFKTLFLKPWFLRINRLFLLGLCSKSPNWDLHVDYCLILTIGT